MSLTDLIFSLIDFRSFSSLWFWIALAVTWSTASHWVLGVPYDMVLRARRHGGEALADLEDVVRVNVNRILFIASEAGPVLVAMISFALTTLAGLGFVYGVEFCQAAFLLLAPLSLVGQVTVRTARRISAERPDPEALFSRLHWHRIIVQIIGMLSILVTAMWGMFQNFTISPLG